ncbi:MAG TPA: hypothetical protein VLA21_00700 [Candidatus Limnocylindria bacterium]|nr:hypothetical protein [Candidatus Limnocylindria bacterium]
MMALEEMRMEDDRDSLAYEEEREAKRDQLRFAAGMGDFIGVIVGLLAILVMVLLILSLVDWLRRDIAGTFTVLNTRLQ